MKAALYTCEAYQFGLVQGVCPPGEYSDGFRMFLKQNYTILEVYMYVQNKLMVIKAGPRLRKQTLYHTEVYIRDGNCSESVWAKRTFVFYSLWNIQCIRLHLAHICSP